MKKISIHLFLTFLLLVAFFVQFLFFSALLEQFEQKYKQLIIQNIQSKAIILKHTLKKNLPTTDIKLLQAALDNFINTSDIFSNMEIKTNSSQLYLYDPSIEHTACTKLANIAKTDLEKIGCIRFSIRIYDHIEPTIYHIRLFLNKNFIHDFLQRERWGFYATFLLFSLIVSLLFWWILKRFIAKPLQQLQSFAGDENSTQKSFLIKEIESIRNSLNKTFQRLRREQKKLYELSTKDPLTKLYNRQKLQDSIDRLIKRSKNGSSTFALLFIDLDNFKNINDIKGHEKGDTILKTVAKRLRNCARKEDLVARFGGDEFVVVLPKVESAREVAGVVKRIQQALSEPIEEYNISASIGVVFYPKDGTDSQTLLKHADMAMYQAKFSGKNKYHFYTSSLNKKFEEEIKMEKEILQALKEDRFELYFQPKFSLNPAQITGFEALLRLKDTDGQLISPAHFIPVAEKCGLIIKLGDLVIQKAIKTLHRWQESPLKNLPLSINVSALQMAERHFPAQLQKSLGSLDPTLLQIEITESVFIFDKELILEHISKLKLMGVRLVLDDFGTGYSSLSYLKTIPLDTLKIDRSFVQDLHNLQDRRFVETILNISQTLGLDVVAEGVEKEDQLKILLELGCQEYQGFILAKPMPAHLIEQNFKQLQSKLQQLQEKVLR